jgi:hypothetical protein
VAQVYSQRLLAAVASSGNTGTVPAGVVWVVRNYILWWNGASDAATEFYSLTIGPAVLVIAAGGPLSSGAHVVERQDTRQVLNPGNTLVWGATTATWTILVSGYALTLP